MEIIASPLEVYLYENPLPPKHRQTVIFNLIEIYNLPYISHTQETEETVIEDIFSNSHELLGHNLELIDVIDDFYTIKGSGLLIPQTKTISDFVNDCYRFWNFELRFDKNLVNRNFNLLYNGN